MFEIKIVNYTDLPNKLKEDYYDYNDNFLLIYIDGELKEMFCDGMEPEDCRFTRDLSWIKDLLYDTYHLGKMDR